jgi:hypothetical protein
VKLCESHRMKLCSIYHPTTNLFSVIVVFCWFVRGKKASSGLPLDASRLQIIRKMLPRNIDDERTSSPYPRELTTYHDIGTTCSQLTISGTMGDAHVPAYSF